MQYNVPWKINKWGPKITEEKHLIQNEKAEKTSQKFILSWDWEFGEIENYWDTSENRSHKAKLFVNFIHLHSWKKRHQLVGLTEMY